jgi:hypothetical protein
LIQSLVADAVSRALDFLYNYRTGRDLNYRIVLQIHDAAILEVPIKEIVTVYNEVLPRCMTDMVDVWPARLDGSKRPDVKEPYHLGIGRDVYLHWGDEIPVLANKVLGIPLEFCSEEASEQGLRDLMDVPGWKKYALCEF